MGRAVLEVVAGCWHSVLATQRVDDLPQDHRIMRALVRETKHIAGIYARVIEEGEAQVGDEVGIVD